jgi:hypothetical protein
MQSEPGNFNTLGVIGSRQIANMNYNICLRKRFCSVTYMKVIFFLTILDTF